MWKRATTWVLPADGTGSAAQVPSGNRERFFGWTSAGELLLTSDSTLSRIRPDGSGYTLLLDQNHRIHDANACGTGAIVFHTHEGDKNIGWMVQADGSNLRRLDFGNFGDQADCSADGKWIVSISLSQTGVQKAVEGTSLLSVETGSSELIEKDTHWYPRISPDGRYILYVRSVEGELLPKKHFAIVVPRHGGPPVFEVPLAGGQPYQWTPDGRGVAYVLKEGDVQNIWVQPLAGGPPRRITNFTSAFAGTRQSGWISDFGWSPDGKQIAITCPKAVADVVMLTDTR